MPGLGDAEHLRRGELGVGHHRAVGGARQRRTRVGADAALDRPSGLVQQVVDRVVDATGRDRGQRRVADDAQREVGLKWVGKALGASGAILAPGASSQGR